MSTSDARGDGSPTEHDDSHGTRTAVNWALAGFAVLGAVAVVAFAYLKVLGTAACTDGRACSGLGPGETMFSLVLYGTPVVAVLGLLVSFLTARRHLGVLVPVCVWAALAIALAVLVVTF